MEWGHKNGLILASEWYVSGWWVVSVVWLKVRWFNLRLKPWSFVLFLLYCGV